MKSGTIWTIVIIILIIIGGWWWYAASISNQPNNIPTTTTQSSSTASGAPMIPALALTVSSSTKLGNFLVAQNGMTLYKYANDSQGVSNCTGSCATAWPPYTVMSGAVLNGGSGVSGQISTITRSDGTTQMTYNGMPLYFYSNDTKPGDTTGQGVGGVWSVIKP